MTATCLAKGGQRPSHECSVSQAMKNSSASFCPVFVCQSRMALRTPMSYFAAQSFESNRSVAAFERRRRSQPPHERTRAREAPAAALMVSMAALDMRVPLFSAIFSVCCGD
eukprot:1298154-Prymnesium_polylepis.2